jgi:S1-C subfamily serine protease
VSRRLTRIGIRVGAAGVLVSVLLLSLGVPAGGAAERYGWLGIRIRDLAESETEELSVKLGVREGYGVMVAETLPDTPAQAAGLRAGDLIVAIDGRPVVETRGLQRLVGATAAGKELAVVVLRDGRRRELRIRVGEMPPDAVADRIAAEFGFLVRDAAPEESPASGPRPGVVAAVLERSAAARAGLEVGDRFVAVNGTAVLSAEAARRELQNATLRDPLRLRVERRGEALNLVLPPAQPAGPVN